MRKKVCPKCKSEMYFAELYERDKQIGWVWVCPNKDYQEEDDPENYFDPDFEYELEVEKNI